MLPKSSAVSGIFRPLTQLTSPPLISCLLLSPHPSEWGWNTSSDIIKWRKDRCDGGKKDVQEDVEERKTSLIMSSSLLRHTHTHVSTQTNIVGTDMMYIRDPFIRRGKGKKSSAHHQETGVKSTHRQERRRGETRKKESRCSSLAPVFCYKSNQWVWVSEIEVSELAGKRGRMRRGLALELFFVYVWASVKMQSDVERSKRRENQEWWSGGADCCWRSDQKEREKQIKTGTVMQFRWGAAVKEQISAKGNL